MKPRRYTHSLGTGVPRHGFVLVLTLVLIVIVAIMLVGLARSSLLLALEARQAQVDLQSRWGHVSLRETVLRRAPALIDLEYAHTNEGATKKSLLPRELVGDVQLGGMAWHIQIADEQAKINLNTYQRERDRQQTAVFVQSQARRSSGLNVRLRPYRVPREDSPLPFYDSWGQVFDLAEGEETSVIAPRLAEATSTMTCWGDGRVHIQAASDVTVEEICRLANAGNAARKLLERRSEQPDTTAAALLADAGLSEQQVADLRRLLTDRSRCYSLWVHVGTDDARRCVLGVGYFADQGCEQIASFNW